jgi:hypothetical protein
MLDSRFHHHSVAHREADGTLSVDCGHSATPPTGAPDAAAATDGRRPSVVAATPPVPPAACAPSAQRIAGALP